MTIVKLGGMFAGRTYHLDLIAPGAAWTLCGLVAGFDFDGPEGVVLLDKWAGTASFHRSDQHPRPDGLMRVSGERMRVPLSAIVRAEEVKP